MKYVMITLANGESSKCLLTEGDYSRLISFLTGTLEGDFIMLTEQQTQLIMYLNIKQIAVAAFDNDT